MSVFSTDLTKEQLERAIDKLVTIASTNRHGPFREDIPFEYDMRTAGPDLVGKAIRSIAEHGIVVVRNYVEPEAAEKLANEVFAFIDPIRPDLQARAPKETDRWIIPHPDDPRFADYPRLANCPKSVITIRDKLDVGMVDIFNIDRLAGTPEMYAPIRNDFVMSVVNGVTQFKYFPMNTNVYYNESVTETRTFHADSFTPQMKAFIYLTDVATDEDGPHWYVLGSHRDMAVRQINGEVGRLYGYEDGTTLWFFDKERARCLFGRKGTLIISMQCGAHRGAPQQPGHKRLVLVQNFMPAARKS